MTGELNCEIVSKVDPGPVVRVAITEIQKCNLKVARLLEAEDGLLAAGGGPEALELVIVVAMVRVRGPPQTEFRVDGAAANVHQRKRVWQLAHRDRAVPRKHYALRQMKDRENKRKSDRRTRMINMLRHHATSST